MFIEISIRNIGNKDFYNLAFSITLPDEIEPISATFLELSGIKKSQTISVPLILKPLYEGILNVEIQINLDNKTVIKNEYWLHFKTNILNNLKNLIGSTISLNIDTKSRIHELERFLIPTINSKTFLKLLEIDPDALISKIRKITEHLIKKIGQRHLSSFNSTWTLAEIIKKLNEANIIDNKIRSYVDTIRVFGNMAAHTNIEQQISFTLEDAIVVSNALVLFISECIKKRLL